MNYRSKMKRRSFLKGLAGAVAAMTVAKAMPTEPGPKPLQGPPQPGVLIADENPTFREWGTYGHSIEVNGLSRRRYCEILQKMSQTHMEYMENEILGESIFGWRKS